ncbi:MAG TPA: ATP-dependent endonuclease [Gallionella sp.]|nr:ATP-dependent endonuclease [Gallionella sp.]
MFIEKVWIENFRSIRNGEVSFGEITTFLGRNGVGKSTVLYALESFYNVGAQYSHLDYYNHQQTDTTIRIRVTYGDLRPDELAEFSSYVHGRKLMVTKVINQGGARYYGTVAQIPAFAELRKLRATEKRNGLSQHVDAGEFPGFPAIPRKEGDVDRAMEEYEVAHPELTQPIERETTFFGPRNVGGGKLDKFTKFVLVPAVRDASTEMEKRGAIMQLLDLIVTRSISSRRDFQEFKQEFETKARQLYGRDNLPELAELGRLISDRLKRYAPGAELLIDFEELKPPTIPLPDAVVTVSEDSFKVPVRYSGHGLQRALILALLEQLSITQPHSAAANDAGQTAEQEPPRVPDLILAIEEPELYLHPARSRYLAKILRDLAQRGANPVVPGTQVVCVTHSPYFVDVEHFDDVRMCRKAAAAEVDQPHVTTFATFTRFEAAQRLAQITGRRPEDFTANTFVARASPVLNSIVNEGLFADVAVVVEGDSDVAALWAMQRFMDQKWDELGVVVVPVNGKNNIDRAVVAFQGFGIPTYFMFDGDKTKNKGASTNRALLQLGTAASIDFPATGMNPSCAVFEDDIETYLQGIAGDRYLPLRDECSARCGYDQSSKALKNSEVMAMFLRDAHAEGIEFPILQQIVERISSVAAALRIAQIGEAVPPEVR